MFQFKKVRKMQNLGNVYIWRSPFVMSRTDAQNGVDIIFRLNAFAFHGCGQQYCGMVKVPGWNLWVLCTYHRLAQGGNPGRTSGNPGECKIDMEQSLTFPWTQGNVEN